MFIIQYIFCIQYNIILQSMMQIINLLNAEYVKAFVLPAV